MPKETGCICLRKKRLIKGNLIAVFQYLKDSYRKDWVNLFYIAPEAVQEAMGGSLSLGNEGEFPGSENN